MFEKASNILNDTTVPCHRYGGCPHGSRVSKEGAKWFCDWCMDDHDVKIEYITRQDKVLYYTIPNTE